MLAYRPITAALRLRLADTHRPDYTAYGCGPAANGFWSGVSFLLAERGYCPEAALYCPTLRREHGRPVAAYPSCTGSELSGGEVPQWRFLRYAYNSAAADAGGYAGGENDIEKEWDSGIWLVRCLHLNVEEFNPDRAVAFRYASGRTRPIPAYLVWRVRTDHPRGHPYKAGQARGH